MNLFHFIDTKLDFKGIWRLLALMCFVGIQSSLIAQVGKDSTNNKTNIKAPEKANDKANEKTKETPKETPKDKPKENKRVKVTDKPKTDVTKANGKANDKLNDKSTDSKDDDLLNNDIAPRPKKSYPKIIKKLSQLGIPQSMITRIRNLNKRDMDSIHGEDYYSNVRDDSRVEYVIKVMLRFVDGRIIGFIKKEPMMHSNKGEYYESEVDIPIEWCGLDSLKQEHCVKSLEEMAAVDSIISIKPEDWHQKPDPGDINTDFAADLNLRLLENKKGRKKNKEEDLNDSTIAIITNGLSGADSVNALKNYVLNGGKRDRNKRKTAELNDSTIATITKGLTGLDSLNAIRDYVTYGGKVKKPTKKRRDDDILGGIDISKGRPNTDSLNEIKHVIIPPKPKKVDMKKRSSDELDDSTIATITKGLTGEDSMNAIRDYIIEAKHSKNQKKPAKKEVVTPMSDSSAAPVIPDKPILAPNNNKKDKKKKGNSDAFPDIRSEDAPEKPTAPQAGQKGIDIRKADNILPPATKDSTTVAKPDVPPVVNGRTRIKKESVLPKTDSVINKSVGDSTKQK